MGFTGRIGGVQPFAELQSSPIADVYKGYQSDLERFVLLKILTPAAAGDEELVEWFLQEARLLARIQHPNVVTVFGCGREAERPFLIAEYVEGDDVEDLVGERPLPLPVALYIARSAAAGLEAVHAESVIHRDVKPANLLVSESGEVKLADFGMASGAEEEGESVRGTADYLAPEQVRGEGALPASDVFSLGATLLQMLTGRSMYRRGSLDDTLEAILHHDPLPRLEMYHAVPEELVRLIGRLIAKDPARRFQDGAAVREAIDQLIRTLNVSMDASGMRAFLHDPEAPLALAAAEPATESTIEESGSPDSEEKPGDAEYEPVHSGSGRGPWIALLASTVVFLLLIATRPDTRPASARETGFVTAVAEPLVGDTAAVQAGQVEEAPADTVAEVEQSGSGALFVNVQPWASVVVGGDTLGTTPLRRALRLPAGRYRVSLANPDFPTLTREVRVEAGKQVRLDASLWSTVGRLEVSASPWAHVAVDEERVDTTPLARPLTLPPGQREITLSHPTLGRWDTTLVVEQGSRHELQISFGAQQ